MSFIDQNSNQPTGLQPGDVIIFDHVHTLLRISRRHTPLCPNVDSDSDDKVIIENINTEYPADFLSLCKLMCNAAGLRAGDVQKKGDDWYVAAEAE